MNVFLSYGAAADQSTALRLQVLAAVNGLSVYVPPAHTRDPTGPGSDPHTASQLESADVVLGVVRFGISEACAGELNRGLQRRVPTIVMADPSHAPMLSQTAGLTVVPIDPSDPTKAERQIFDYLTAVDAEMSAKTSLLALGTVALGLLLFAGQES